MTEHNGREVQAGDARSHGENLANTTNKLWELSEHQSLSQHLHCVAATCTITRSPNAPSNGFTAL